MLDSLPDQLRSFPICRLRPVGRRVFIAETGNGQRFAVILGQQRHRLMVLELLTVH